MNKIVYRALDESLETCVLPNGLRVLVNKKPGFMRKVCYFAVDFGSLHTDFTYEGRHVSVPAGVAHYLEHKLFELPERDVTAEFAALGVAVNAFTSYDLTAYHISCTERFEQALRLLLEFVSTPYFTRESVDREQGIIAQEIGMSEDDPGGRCFENLMAALYEKHPIRVPILGTVQTIAEITPQTLELCHRAFYTPENMVLCVVGDVDTQCVCDIARQVLGDERRPTAQKDPFPSESMHAFCDEVTQTMEVAMPTFSMAIKATCPEKGEAAIRRELVGELAAEVLFGESSWLYMDLYDKGLIDATFGGGFDTVDGCAMLTCGGDSVAPRAVRDAVLAQAEKIVRDGVDETDFLRTKRSAMGRRIQELDSFGTTCFRLCAYEMSDFDYFRFPELYHDIGQDEIRAFLAQTVCEDACSLSIIYPNQGGTI